MYTKPLAPPDRKTTACGGKSCTMSISEELGGLTKFMMAVTAASKGPVVHFQQMQWT